MAWENGVADAGATFDSGACTALAFAILRSNGEREFSLFSPVAVIVALEGEAYPWQNLRRRDVQIRVLTVFITWACLRFLQSILDVSTRYSLVSRDTQVVP